MEATLTLHQAGNQLGVGESVLSRLIRIGALPEARKVHRADGPVWVIPVDDLQSVATRNGWTIDLRDDDGWISADPKTNDPWISPDQKTNDLWIRADSKTSDSPNRGGGSTGDVAAAPLPGADKTPMEMMAEEPISGAIVPHDDPAERDGSAIEVSESTEGAPSMVEAMDMALLDRLLGVQEERVSAQVEARETKHALTALNEAHNRTTGELEIERRERMVTADRYREERMARAVADAKIAELRDRVVREMSLADAEKQARSEALARSIRAEREAANAMASMGWMARRRYKRLSRSDD